MTQSNNCLTVTVSSPMLILWRMTAQGSFEFSRLLTFVTARTRIRQCDSKNSSTHFPFSTFPRMSYEVSQALLVTSHPLPQGPSNSQCVWPHPEPLLYPSSDWSLHPAASKGPWDHPDPAGLKKRTITQGWLVLPSLSQSRCFGAEWKHSLQLTQNPLRVLKAALFLIFGRLCSCLSWKLGAKTANSPSAKMWRGQQDGLVRCNAGKYTLSARVHVRTNVCVYEHAISKPPSVPPTQLEWDGRRVSVQRPQPGEPLSVI